MESWKLTNALAQVTISLAQVTISYIETYVLHASSNALTRAGLGRLGRGGLRGRLQQFAPSTGAGGPVHRSRAAGRDCCLVVRGTGKGEGKNVDIYLQRKIC